MGYLGWVGVTFLAALVGSVAAAGAPDFYRQLRQPVWAPPGWLFGPVWTALYLLMGLGAGLIWTQGAGRRWPLRLYLAQLVLNAAWTWLFFFGHLGGAAFAEILLLWLVLTGTLVAFWRSRPLAGFLLVPGLVWISYAAVLAWSAWRLNPGLLG
nr:TspO/MBR family protein [uncultured Holophaga sp.]